MEVLKFRRVLPNSETPRSESNIENLLLQPHPEEVRRLAGGEGPVVAVLLELVPLVMGKRLPRI